MPVTHTHIQKCMPINLHQWDRKQSSGCKMKEAVDPTDIGVITGVTSQIFQPLLTLLLIWFHVISYGITVLMLCSSSLEEIQRQLATTRQRTWIITWKQSSRLHLCVCQCSLFVNSSCSKLLGNGTCSADTNDTGRTDDLASYKAEKMALQTIATLHHHGQHWITPEQDGYPPCHTSGESLEGGMCYFSDEELAGWDPPWHGGELG